MKNIFIFLLCLIFSIPVFAEDLDDHFLMEDFADPIPDYVREDAPLPEELPEENIEDEDMEDYEEEEEEEEVSINEKISGPEFYSVKKRTYLSFSYGQINLPGGSSFDDLLKSENNYFETTHGFTKKPFTTPLVSAITGGLEVRKGWRDRIMLGLSVESNVGQSPETTIEEGGHKLVASAKFDITTSFINIYRYAPLGKDLEYFVGAGFGVCSGVVEYSEELNNDEYIGKILDKASGIQIFTGLDWHLSKAILEFKLFYRAMELKNISLSGGGGTFKLVFPF